MQKSFHPNNIISIFEKMEVDNSLFELKYKNKFAVWDLCRRDIFLEIIRILKKKPNKFPYEVNSYDKYKNYFKKIYNNIILFFLSFKKAETLVIAFRRFKRKNLIYDFSIDPIASKLDDCFYLDFANPSLFKAIFLKDSSYPSFKIIIKSYNDINNISKYIDECIFKNFKVNFNSKPIVNHSLNCFFTGEFFFKNLIKNLKCQRVMYSDNGILKSIPYVCSKINIPCFEVQHGASPKSIIWTYPAKKKVFLNKKNCYYPDYFILWGDYWKKIYNLPSKFIISGTHNYIEKCNHLDGILFISDISNYLYFSSIAKQLANTLPYRKIFFKLHPSQFNEFSKIKLDFKNQKNIKIITDEIENKKLLSKVSDFVAIRSSLIYLALQSGCRGHILKQNDYNWDEELFNFTHQFSKVHELIKNLNKKSSKPQSPNYFEKISINTLRKYL